ncbi:non-hydrolyzing UDP-N-acetylglucosamine 2-epimerase [Elusimicrobiota bacterium]
MKKKVLSIFGTRPEAIKMAPVIRELERYPDIFESVVCVTAQHRQMLDQFLDLFNIDPDIDLDLMEENQSLDSFSAKALKTLTKAIGEINPDLVLVQGDTTTAMIAALASFYLKIPVGHIEAGLRTGNKYNPFPEEINRNIIGVLAAYHFAPTQSAGKALMDEGIDESCITVTGNTVVDALNMILEGIEGQKNITDDIVRSGCRMILVTSHRRENIGKPLENICEALKEIVEAYPDVEIVYPVHLNPDVQDTVNGKLKGWERINLIEPVEYLDLIQLLRKAYIVLTDSGGIQEEAPVLGKPVLVLRRETERPEGIEAGVAKIVGTEKDDIVREAGLLLNDDQEYEKMAQSVSPYGDGTAAEKIIAVLKKIVARE